MVRVRIRVRVGLTELGLAWGWLGIGVRVRVAKGRQQRPSQVSDMWGRAQIACDGTLRVGIRLSIRPGGVLAG